MNNNSYFALGIYNDYNVGLHNLSSIFFYLNRNGTDNIIIDNQPKKTYGLHSVVQEGISQVVKTVANVQDIGSYSHIVSKGSDDKKIVLNIHIIGDTSNLVVQTVTSIIEECKNTTGIVRYYIQEGDSTIEHIKKVFFESATVEWIESQTEHIGIVEVTFIDNLGYWKTTTPIVAFNKILEPDTVNTIQLPLQKTGELYPIFTITPTNTTPMNYWIYFSHNNKEVIWEYNGFNHTLHNSIVIEFENGTSYFTEGDEAYKKTSRHFFTSSDYFSLSHISNSIIVNVSFNTTCIMIYNTRYYI